jgi:hypothetical protein
VVAGIRGTKNSDKENFFGAFSLRDCAAITKRKTGTAYMQPAPFLPPKAVTAGRAGNQIPVAYVPFVNRKHFAISRPQAPVSRTAGLSRFVNFQIHTARQKQAAARAAPRASPLPSGGEPFYIAGIEQA